MFQFECLNENHRKAVIEIFNYYVQNTNAAYPQEKVEESLFDAFLENAKSLCGYAILNDLNKVIGFCQLKPYRPGSTFDKTVEITYFIAPESTRIGIGSQILKRLEEEASKLGKEHILASISGDNIASLRFHEKNGFIFCGRFNKIGFKHNKYFDIVYMQKDIKKE